MEKRIDRDTDYSIDTDGNVYSYKSGKKRKLSTSYNKKRGNVVYLGKKGVSVQLLMAETFLEKPDDCDMVSHRNGDHTDNRVENIFWTSERRIYEKNMIDSLNRMPQSNNYEKRICEIKGYEDLKGYTVTSDGIVYSYLGENKISLNPSINSGYFQVRLGSRLNRHITRKVHRLVAEAFISNPQSKKQVNHIDGNKQNNHVSNLEWVNNTENQRHAIINKLKDCRAVSVYDLEGNLIKEFPSLVFAREYFGIKHHSLVQEALKGKYKQAYGYVWKYSE